MQYIMITYLLYMVPWKVIWNVMSSVSVSDYVSVIYHLSCHLRIILCLFVDNIYRSVQGTCFYVNTQDVWEHVMQRG